MDARTAMTTTQIRKLCAAAKSYAKIKRTQESYECQRIVQPNPPARILKDSREDPFSSSSSSQLGNPRKGGSNDAMLARPQFQSVFGPSTHIRKVDTLFWVYITNSTDLLLGWGVGGVRGGAVGAAGQSVAPGGGPRKSRGGCCWAPRQQSGGTLCCPTQVTFPQAARPSVVPLVDAHLSPMKGTLKKEKKKKETDWRLIILQSWCKEHSHSLDRFLNWDIHWKSFLKHGEW